MGKRLSLQFETLEQQTQSAILGLWVFLATEVLFFGGLFLAYAVYRTAYPAAFILAARQLDVRIGTINTALLLTSSLFMAFGVEAARLGRRRALVLNLVATEFLGLAFLSLKALEYAEDVRKNLLPDPTLGAHGSPSVPSAIFYFIYYVMTGVHAFHLTVGLALIAVLIWRARRNDFSGEYHAPVEVVGLYWHFVDVVWIFLYPLLYLVGRYQ